MAINFNITNLKDISKTNKLEIAKIEENGKTFEFTTTTKNTKDPIYVFVDLTNAFISCRLDILNEDGELANAIILSSKGINLIPLTTFGYVTKDGSLNFRITGLSGDIESDFGISVGAFSHTPVINN